MSAIARLTEETLVLEKGRLARRAPTSQAIDYYLASGFSQQGERAWQPDEVPGDAAPFRPRALRVRSGSGQVVDTVRSVEPFTIEVEYELTAPVTGLRVGLYLQTMRGEHVFTSFDTDSPAFFEQYSSRSPGCYVSRCCIPADLFNEGRFLIGLNASSYRIRRYFQDDQALAFTVDAAGAAGTHWPEPRLGPVRPRLSWQIEAIH
jgi:lipopolysaccharide transport system ATP-binding protein